MRQHEADLDAAWHEYFRVALSRDGGTTYTPIAACSGLPGTAQSCVWTPTGPATTTALVRVTARGGGATSVSDASNAPFAITGNTPTVTVTAPNTAVAWAAGSRRVITWNHNLGATSAVRIELTRNGGATWDELAPSVANATATTGSWPWIVSGPVSGQALVRVSQVGGPASDESNSAFAIAAPSIVVTAPNTNVNWTVDSSRQIRWTHNLGTAEFVNLESSRDGGVSWASIAAGVPNAGDTTGVFTWTVNGPVTSAARVRVTWPAGAAQDTSDVDFRVGSRIAVTAPNTALTWGAESTRTVTWNHDYGVARRRPRRGFACHGLRTAPCRTCPT